MIEFKINNGALESCITDEIIVVIPEEVNRIKKNAFMYQLSIEELIMGDNVSVIEESAFNGCVFLKRVKLSKKIETIGQNAFEDCFFLEEINLENIKYLNFTVFDSCFGLKKVTFSSKLKYINTFAFYNCTYLEAIEVSSSNKEYVSIDGVLYNKDMTEIIFYPLGKNSKSYVIPESIESLSRNFFFANDKIESITLNKRITEIPSDAFSCCSGLKEVNNLENISEMLKYC